MSTGLILLVLIGALVAFGWTRLRGKMKLSVSGKHWLGPVTSSSAWCCSCCGGRRATAAAEAGLPSPLRGISNQTALPSGVGLDPNHPRDGTRRWGPHHKLESRPNLSFNGFSNGL